MHIVPYRVYYLKQCTRLSTLWHDFCTIISIIIKNKKYVTFNLHHYKNRSFIHIQRG